MPLPDLTRTLEFDRLLREDLTREFGGREMTPELTKRFDARLKALVAIKDQLLPGRPRE